MNETVKERRCKSCGKLLLDEKLPFCKRCVLEGRNKAGKVGGAVSGLALAFLSTKSLINDNSNEDFSN
ncbi:MAG: hypothetical protein NC548_38710 [Lachnospiraceae bacterium]|nr:hypothetical protein [Lachnospiraceae bacterium]